MSFGMSGVLLLVAGLLRAYQRAGGPVSSGLQAFVRRAALGRGASKLSGSVGVMMLMCRRLSILSTPPLVLCCFFGVVSSRLLMFLRVSVRLASLRVGGMPCMVGGRLFASRSPGFTGSPRFVRCLKVSL